MLNFLFSMALLFYFCFCFAKSTLVKKDQHLIKLKGNIKTQCLKASLKSPKSPKCLFFKIEKLSHAFFIASFYERTFLPCFERSLFGALAFWRARFWARTLIQLHTFFPLLSARFFVGILIIT